MYTILNDINFQSIPLVSEQFPFLLNEDENIMTRYNSLNNGDSSQEITSLTAQLSTDSTDLLHLEGKTLEYYRGRSRFVRAIRSLFVEGQYSLSGQLTGRTSYSRRNHKPFFPNTWKSRNTSGKI